MNSERVDSPSFIAYVSRKSPKKTRHAEPSMKAMRGSKLRMKQYSLIPVNHQKEARVDITHLKESLTVQKIGIPVMNKYNHSSAPQNYFNTSFERHGPYIGRSLRESIPKSTPKPMISRKPREIKEPLTPKRNIESRTESTKSRVNESRVDSSKPVVKRPAVLPKIQLKEASRDKEWLLKAKPEIEKMWRKVISRSNGVESSVSEEKFKVFVGRGNNSVLIKKCFSSRSWWTQTQHIEEADFIWTQWKEKELLRSFPCVFQTNSLREMYIPVSFMSPVRLKFPNGQLNAVDIESLGFSLIRNSESYKAYTQTPLDPHKVRMHNKIEFNQHLANKKGLYMSMKKYYQQQDLNVFDFLPLTFHLKQGESDPEFEKFLEEFEKCDQEKLENTRFQNLWIVKPGENSNRGQGISVCSTLAQIKQELSSSVNPKTGAKRTFIIQKYIEKPFLVHKRKFDIRCFALVTCVGGVMQAYFYKDGYLRTACTEYTVKDVSNNFVHLTNDAIQKHSEDYGKFETGNKLSYKDFQRYLDFHCSDRKVNFYEEILPQIKALVKDTIQAVYVKLDPNRRGHTMELFGYDFMLDNSLKPWLIEVNTNPCLELSSPYLSLLIPTMVENALRIAVDPLFVPNVGTTWETLQENRFELIFHEAKDGAELLARIERSNLEETEEVSDKEELYSEDETND